jgi:uncharacterized protein YbaA (DUF1428 family)
MTIPPSTHTFRGAGRMTLSILPPAARPVSRRVTTESGSPVGCPSLPGTGRRLQRPVSTALIRQLKKEHRMAHYVDGYVVPVPKKKIAAYRRMAQKAGKIWREHGALEFVETVADDVKPGKVTSFPQSVKLKAGETVVFSYIVYKSRKDRDRVNAKVMKDKRLEAMMNPKSMPFDAKRMFWGGFRVMVAL